MSTVLAAIDNTPAARSVLATTQAVCQALHLEARVLHVGDSPGQAAEHAQEFGLSLQVVPGRPEARIIEAGEHPDIDLVVLALHGLPGRNEPGHTARAVSTRLTKPVLVVPPDAPIRQAPHKVLFPLDGTRGVSTAVRPLIAAYVAAGAEVIAVHVFQPDTVPRFLDGAPDEAVWREEFLATHCADLGIRLETRPGPTVLALLDVAATEDVDVIALGWRQSLAPERAYVVREVLQRARRPVALIPRSRRR
jgi:nucleotide-binding universal stress UspA family protein